MFKNNLFLQVILDNEIVKDRDIFKVASELVDGGAGCIQFRDKVSCDRVLLEEAKKIRKIAKDCVFIINDRVDIARLCGADGVHLGQDDLPYEEARKLIGKNRLIGMSTHNIDQAKEAQALGADYIGVGPIFPTMTKPDLKAIGLEIVEAVAKDIEIPVFFIGGINLSNLEEVTKRGGSRVAVASAILNSDDIAGATSALLSVIARRREAPRAERSEAERSLPARGSPQGTKQSKKEIASAACPPTACEPPRNDSKGDS